MYVSVNANIHIKHCNCQVESEANNHIALYSLYVYIIELIDSICMDDTGSHLTQYIRNA